MSTDLPPLVSIGIATHNAEETALRALDSALRQTWPNVEVVVVDDSSTDGTWEMVTAFASKHSNVTVRQNVPNGGVACVRNTIVGIANGEFICFLDDDDLNRSDRVERQISRILAYEESHGTDMIFCYCGRDVVAGGTVHTAPSPIGSNPPEPFGPSVADYVLGLPAAGAKNIGGPMGCGTMMARKTTLQRAGLFDVKFRRAEEMDLAVRAALMGAHFISVDEPLITQYKTAGVEKAGTKPLQYSLLLLEKHRAYLQGRRLYLASQMFARSSFWGSKKRKILARFYRAFGYALAPQLIPARFKRRSGRVV